MPLFQIEVPVKYIRVYHLEAENEEDALDLFMNGEGDMDEDTENEAFGDLNDEIELVDEAKVFEVND